jgi:hypothetical protein
MSTTELTDSSSTVAILARVLDPEEGPLAPEAAQYVLSLRFRQRDRERMALLAEKAQQGNLTTGEQSELENYCNVGDLLALIQSKARQALQATDLGR